ncbi:MAG: TlpA disulfide reductase family protein [bacterium]|nr:TlpA disulfide reductase family protein [bacterium]
MSGVERSEQLGAMSAGEAAGRGGGFSPGGDDPAVPGPPEVGTAGSRRRRRAVALVALTVAAVVAVLVIFLALGDPQRGALIGRSAVGQPAPPILGVTLTGDVFDLDEQRGRWVVVNFFATWCPGCIIEHPELVTFSERHAAGDAIVVTVAFDDSPEAVRGFFERAGGDWPVLAGDVGSVPVDYGVTAVPETYIVSPAGYVVDKLVGARGVTADQLDARIAALEALGDAAGTAP